MKDFRFYLLAATIAVIGCFTSCSDDEPTTPTPDTRPVDERIIIDNDGLPDIENAKYPSQSDFESYLVGKKWCVNKDHYGNGHIISDNGIKISYSEYSNRYDDDPIIYVIDDKNMYMYIHTPCLGWQYRVIKEYSYDAASGWISVDGVKTFRLIKLDGYDLTCFHIDPKGLYPDIRKYHLAGGYESDEYLKDNRRPITKIKFDEINLPVADGFKPMSADKFYDNIAGHEWRPDYDEFRTPKAIMNDGTLDLGWNYSRTTDPINSETITYNFLDNEHVLMSNRANSKLYEYDETTGDIYIQGESYILRIIDCNGMRMRCITKWGKPDTDKKYSGYCIQDYTKY